jgi:hypothetical protein
MLQRGGVASAGGRDWLLIDATFRVVATATR